MQINTEKRSHLDWASLISEHEKSGLTQKEFYSKQGLVLPQFCYSNSIAVSTGEKMSAIPVNNKKPFRMIVAIIYATIIFLDRLDLTIVNITLPTLAKYYHVPITQTEWVTNAFLFALAMSIPISNWLADQWGDKFLFIASTTLFGLASLLCACAPNLSIMVFSRFLQGIGGGMLIPVGMSMVYRAFDRSEYASITSYIFLPTLIAPAIAPSIGGLIIAISNWQWVFLFSVPICILVIFFSVIFMEKTRVETKTRFDYMGFISATGTLLLLLYAISNFGKEGLSLYVILLFSIGMAFATIFYLNESRVKSPLFEIHFFRNKLFLQANVIQILFQMCHFGSIFLIGMYLQVGVGMSAMISGLIMGSQAVGAMMTSRLSVRLFNLYGAGFPIRIGFIGILVFTAAILWITVTDNVLVGMAILFMRGIFSGLCGTPIQAASIIGFDHKDVGRASALFNASRQVAISLGVAVSAVFITYGFKRHGLPVAPNGAVVGLSVFYPAFGVQAVLAIIGLAYASRLDDEIILANIAEH